MALRKAIAKRLLNTPLINKTTVPPNAAKTNFHREYLTSPESSESGFFRRFIQRRDFYQSAKLPDFMSLPVGEKLKEKLKSVSVSGGRLRLDGLSPPATVLGASGSIGGISVTDAKKIMRSVQLEKVRSELRRLPVNSVSWLEYVQICVDVCEQNRDQGTEYAKKLDESGDVIVLGNVVFLRPEQVAKSMEKMISTSIAIPNDPRRQELEAMEKQKALIDRKAQQQVRGELYSGLGFLALQTLGFMRLTFWELSWDVMEPICFFVTSLHFALAYGFFLRTSTEPTFEGFFQRRFRTKQKKLMEAHNFDVERYNQLCRAFYPNFSDVKGSDHAGGAIFSAVHG